MPSRPTVQCCRIVQQHIRAPLDNIWITDGVLASAFERYCHVSRLARRKSSSLPGPLESRKRLGRRKMTDVHMDHQSTLPPWAIEFPVDLSQWKWQPPTARRAREGKDTQSQHSQSVLSWVATPRMEGIQIGKEDTRQVQDEIYSSTNVLMGKLLKARSAVAASTPQAIESTYYHFIGGLQQDLQLGILDPEDLDIAVSTFPQSLFDTETDRDVVNAAIEMFLSAVVNGIASSKVLGPKEFEGSFWNQLLMRIAQLPVNDATTLLFQTTLDAIPSHYVSDVQEGIIAAVQTLTMSRSTGRKRAADIGVALRELSSADHGTLLRKMETAVYEGSTAFGEAAAKKLRFVWLQILAHMPQVKQDYLLDACVRSAYFDPEVPEPLGRDLSRLLIQQWNSRGYLQNHEAIEARWSQDSAEQSDLSLAALVIHVCDCESPGRTLALLRSLLKAVRRFGCQDELMSSIQRFCKSKDHLPVQPFKQLAIASDDYNMALVLLTLLESHATKVYGKIQSQWNWTRWTKYVEAMIKDESLDIATVWKVVSSGATMRNQSAAQRERLTKKKAALLENMVIWFSQAEHLTDRTRLRHMSLCVTWLQDNHIKLSRKVVTALVMEVTQDLKRGEYGRSRRIGWVLDLVGRYQGPEERRAVARVFQRWRVVIGELDAKKPSDE
ncbi:uncharacterized protein CTRU02_205982 [Colletotrichum truncatum]|uniref:Uncharacterized protein n=1 Tax=Colletotrichum truncatum TaxID=5467 RepID=A0ACC3Z5Q2_COLTU|nr:uncharacterized protein CTRU02_04816 [Colletotrichum truncatum]KAF6795253.1 hypothetical protein CTRU02_04816 [Colletotrichum truncatum]